MVRQRIDTYQNLLSLNRKLQIYLFVGPERHLQHYDCHCTDYEHDNFHKRNAVFLYYVALTSTSINGFPNVRMDIVINGGPHFRNFKVVLQKI